VITVPPNTHPDKWTFKLKTAAAADFRSLTKNDIGDLLLVLISRCDEPMEIAIPPLLGRVVQRYIRAFAPERIVLFGPWAKGTNNPRSDLDLLVVADMEGDPGVYLRRAKQLAAECFPPLDIVFVSPDEMEPPELDRNPFLLSVLKAGIVLYFRGSIEHN
jgi:uncharacterized protein